MKKALKLTSLLTLIFMLTIFSCNKDDEDVKINLQDLEVTINENPTDGEVIGTVQSDSNNSLTYSITTQTPSGAMSIDAATGELTVADGSLFDFETNPIITATVSATEAVNTATVTITINNASEVTILDFETIIDENPTNGQSIGTIQATGGVASNFSIVSQTPAGALSINATTGELTVANATLFDYETSDLFIANITADDAINLGLVEIELDNVDEITIQDFTVTIDENPTNGQSLGTVQTTGGPAIDFVLISEPIPGAINVDETTGELTVADAALFDFETNPTIIATVTVDDAINPATVTINLNDIAEPASIGDFRDGGVVFWVDPTNNNHGLVVAVSSQYYSGTWGCSGTNTGATGSAIGTGISNTSAIVNSGCATTGSIFEVVSNLSLNGYDDWFVPSEGELSEMFANINVVNAAITANGGQVTYQFHWSSTEINSTAARLVNLTTGVIGGSGKDGNIYFTKPVRAF